MENIQIHKLYKRKKNDRDIFQELMPFKIKEILFVATYYDAYTVEQDGQFTNKILGEYLQVNLYTAPRFTSVASLDEAKEILDKRHIDLIIIMAGLDKIAPIKIGKELKELSPSITQLMLVNNNSDLAYFLSMESEIKKSFEKIFVWNGSTNIFLAMSKYIEDKKNINPDVKLGNISVILLVENSVKYYSKYLPLLFSEVVTQTQKLIESESDDKEMGVVMKIRVRPKVILVTNYEDAQAYVDKYHKNIIGVISDVKYNRNGKDDENAGIELIKYVHSKDLKIPCLLQSHDECNRIKAQELDAAFINKNSVTLSLDIKSFIKKELWFGDFIFRDSKGEIEIDRASSIDEFMQKILTLPEESLIYHTKRDHFSRWLMARGKINLASHFKRYAYDDFKNKDDLVKFLIRGINISELQNIRGNIVNFSKKLVDSNRYITRLGRGSSGGKGRGMTFLCNFLENTSLHSLIPNQKIKIPQTSIIGTNEFDSFVENNNLDETIYQDISYEKIKDEFVKGDISKKLKDKLYRFLSVIKKPLAIRSSGLFEDSMNQPFAGVYATYLIPNNDKDDEVRYKELETAIKLVWSSIFTDSSKAYFHAIDSLIEEEKMGVVVQEVVGTEHNGRFYPNLSGVAQSYNFYPFSYIKPEDGFSVIAMGLGSYVVGGEKTYRFCPSYPKVKMNNMQEEIRDSQKYLYAIDLVNKNYDLVRDGEDAAIITCSLEDAEKDQTLQKCATVFDYMNNRMSFDFNDKGPRVVNFEKIVQYDDFPLSNILKILLKIFSQAMGAPIEIEFAANYENGKWIFYLLQIKPLIKQEYHIEINEDDIDFNKVILKSDKGMGNGIIKNIKDIIYIDPQKFDKLETEEMTEEIRTLNSKMQDSSREYLLIGPGRWGTRDKFTGIPVLWNDISKAKVIIEQGLKNFPLDSSMGSHFFHNVTSMNIGYYAIPFNSQKSFIKYNKIKDLKVEEKTKHAIHLHLDKAMTILMDGKNQIAIISL